MLVFRKELFIHDIKNIKEILSSTGYFNASPDEMAVAVELAELALREGNTPENYAFLFMQYCEKTIGYVCFARVPCTRSTYEIYWLGVHNEFRGKGYGKSLMQEAISYIRQFGATKIVLQTAGRDLYIPTQKFYEAVGYKLEARLKDYYDKGDDGLIYSMDLE